MPAKKDRGQHERRLRVVCHLPINDNLQVKAVYRVIDYLETLRLSSPHFGVGGFTHSNIFPPVFGGYWWSDDRQDWMQDRLVLLVVDFILNPGEPVPAAVQQLKSKINNIYKAIAKQEEEVVWVVAHDLVRQT